MNTNERARTNVMDFKLNQMRNVNDPNDYLDMYDEDESFEGLKVI